MNIIDIAINTILIILFLIYLFTIIYNRITHYYFIVVYCTKDNLIKNSLIKMPKYKDNEKVSIFYKALSDLHNSRVQIVNYKYISKSDYDIFHKIT